MPANPGMTHCCKAAPLISAAFMLQTNQQTVYSNRNHSWSPGGCTRGRITGEGKDCPALRNAPARAEPVRPACTPISYVSERAFDAAAVRDNNHLGAHR